MAVSQKRSVFGESQCRHFAASGNVHEALNEQSEGTGQLVACIFDQLGHPPNEMRDSLGNDDPELAEQTADLVGLGRAGPHETLAHAGR
jgi:hypothetical protein